MAPFPINYLPFSFPIISPFFPPIFPLCSLLLISQRLDMLVESLSGQSLIDERKVEMAVHHSVVLDRLVLWLGFYDGNKEKAKQELGKFGMYAIDSLWDEGLKIWRKKHQKWKVKEERKKQKTIVVRVKGKGKVKVN